MKFPHPLIKGRFKSRYKRFFADVELENGTLITAHVPNTGSLKGCLNKEAVCYLSFSDSPHRKLKYTLQIIQTPSSWVGVNTHLSNDLVWEAFQQDRMPLWPTPYYGQREIKINSQTRIDFVFCSQKENFPLHLINQKKSQNKFHFVEVKNVTLLSHSVALFPDAVSQRGQKHLKELMNLMNEGHQAEIIFTVQRTDAQSFAPAKEIDPRYAELLKEAYDKGLRISPYTCQISPEEITLQTQKPLKILF